MPQQRNLFLADQGIEAVELLEAEIECLIRRMIEVDPDAIHRVEKLFHRVKIQIIVEKCHH